MMIIAPGDLDDGRIIELLHIHLTQAQAESPPGSVHALDLTALKAPEISFFAAWQNDTLMGVGALKHLSPAHAEIKSMHTPRSVRGRGAGGAMLRHIIDTAQARGYARLSLETGSMDYFAPARSLYRRHGFTDCEPFGDYIPDPNSVFMTLML